MPKTYCLEARGDFACFTRPEMKVERVSYDVITPSAVRAVFEAVFWKPAIRWIPTMVEILKPVKWTSVRRNEVSSKVSADSAQTAMKRGNGGLGLYIEEDRVQRAGLFLRDVAYRLHARMELCARECQPRYPRLQNLIQDEEEHNSRLLPVNEAKYWDMFERRARKGQCINQPYLGCREFACSFTLVEGTGARPEPIAESRDLGWMLFDMDFSNPADPLPRFFQAKIVNGVALIPEPDSKEVRG